MCQLNWLVGLTLDIKGITRMVCPMRTGGAVFYTKKNT